MSTSTARRNMAHVDLLDTSSQRTVSASSRRADIAQDEDHTWAHRAKIGRRESRLGLRSIFGRSKAPKEADPSPHSTSYGSRSASLRASIAELGHWPEAHGSDAALSSSPSWQHLPVTPELPQAGQIADHELVDAKEQRSAPRPSKQPRNSVVTWTMPPLFKAFPQAIRHVTLPAATMSADAILRLNEKNHSVNLPEDAAHGIEDDAHEGAWDKEKRIHRRNASAAADSLEWTAKIYVLVTSGYVLQYAGDGHFDRLPEKVLRLGPTSAAFATDAIPGRHWVLHVSSTTEADGTPTLESRSLFSKLPFRIDRRNASNLLMVFESAHVMEAWIITLRGEIEKLGGKKNLSETGRPKTVESTQHLREQHSQRTLIVKDGARISRSGGGHAIPTRGREARNGDGSVRWTSPDTIRGQSLDDDSTSNSVVSQDERQLDNLRESSNRLSFLSTDQRTIVTSADSSPERSPMQGSLTSRVDGMPAQPSEYADVVVRPRPNASDISLRRQSVQVAGPFVDQHGDQDSHDDHHDHHHHHHHHYHHHHADQGRSRPPSVCGTVTRSDGAFSPVEGRPTPNFSVPNSSSRRFSHARAPLGETDGLPPHERAYGTSPPAAGGKPRPALRATRTLSMIMDHSPARDAAPERPATGYKGIRRATPTKWTSQQQLRSASRARESMYGDSLSGRASNTVSQGKQNGRVGSASIGPRRLSSVEGAMGKQQGTVPRTGRNLAPPGPCREPREVSLFVAPRDDNTERYRSSFLDVGGSPRSRSVEPTCAASRASMNSTMAKQRSARPTELHSALFIEPPLGGPPSAPLPQIPSHGSSPYLAVDTKTKALFNRRSMPQLTEGPPPAPPPTRALPPIPIPHQFQLRT